MSLIADLHVFKFMTLWSPVLFGVVCIPIIDIGNGRKDSLSWISLATLLLAMILVLITLALLTQVPSWAFSSTASAQSSANTEQIAASETMDFLLMMHSALYTFLQLRQKRQTAGWSVLGATNYCTTRSSLPQFSRTAEIRCDFEKKTFVEALDAYLGMIFSTNFGGTTPSSLGFRLRSPKSAGVATFPHIQVSIKLRKVLISIGSRLTTSFKVDGSVQISLSLAFMVSAAPMYAVEGINSFMRCFEAISAICQIVRLPPSQISCIVLLNLFAINNTI